MKSATLMVANCIFFNLHLRKDIFRNYCLRNFQIEAVTKDLKSSKTGRRFMLTYRMREFRRIGDYYRKATKNEPWFFSQTDNATYSLNPSFVVWICDQLGIDFKKMRDLYQRFVDNIL